MQPRSHCASIHHNTGCSPRFASSGSLPENGLVAASLIGQCTHSRGITSLEAAIQDRSTAMAEFPSGTVAFLFTDIEGSTKRWERDRDGMATAVERHFALLQDAIAASDGVLFKTIGDAVQAAFPTVPGAVAAAVAAQSALRAEDWGDLGQLRVRMAVHVGEATPRDGDYLSSLPEPSGAPARDRVWRAD